MKAAARNRTLPSTVDELPRTVSIKTHRPYSETYQETISGVVVLSQ